MGGYASIAASDELAALCQAQIDLLVQVAGAAWCAVYLAESDADTASPNLVPVAVYPDGGDRPMPANALEPASLLSPPRPTLLADRLALPVESPATACDQPDFERGDRPASDSQQFVLPLLHNGTALGLLVARRRDRAWNSRELATAERVARTLALACWLYRRQQGYRDRLEARERTIAQQRDRLSDLLHQLRNPLTALRTFGKLLLKRLQADDANRQVAVSLVGESDRLQDLLREFDVCIEAMALEPRALPASPVPKLLPPGNDAALTVGLLQTTALRLESLAIATVLTPLTHSAAAIAQERHLAFASDIPAALPPVRGNARALREVFSNLLDNALKYTLSGGSVQLVAGLSRTEAGRVFQGTAIRDTGVGIPPADRAHLFERHYRGVQAAGEIAGTGLGLAIARELVEAMDGTIEVTSPLPESEQAALGDRAPAPGTQFVVWLPVAAAP